MSLEAGPAGAGLERTLDRDYYFSEDIYARERERIFYRECGTSARSPFAGLNEDDRVRHKGELIYPNLLLSLSAEHVAAFTVWPRGPEHTTIVCEFLFHPAEIAKPSFGPSDVVEFWDLVNRQDWTICESVQRGMWSRVFRSGYYAPMESASLDIRRYIREKLGDSKE